MKGTFDVLINIDGNKVKNAMGLQKGFESFNLDAFSRVQAAVFNLKKKLSSELQKTQKK